MSTLSTRPSPLIRRAIKERRASGSLRWLKSVLRRPLHVERCGMLVQFVLQERRRPLHVQEAEALQALIGELRAFLKSHEQQPFAGSVQHLAAVHAALAGRGWSGVQALPSRLLREAQAEARALLRDEKSDTLEHLAESLSAMRGAAEAREDRIEQGRAADLSTLVVVSETSQEDFEAQKRSWAGVVLQPQRPTTPI